MASYQRRDVIQNEGVHSSSKPRTSVHIRRRSQLKESRVRKNSVKFNSPPDDKSSDLDAGGSGRLERIDTTVGGIRKKKERKEKMKYVGETITKVQVVKGDPLRGHRVSGSRRRGKADPEHKRRHHKKQAREADTGKSRAVHERHYREQDVESETTETTITEEKKRNEVDIIDAQVRTPSKPDTRTVESRLKAADRERPRGQDGMVRSQRQTPQRRKTEPVKQLRHVHRTSYGIDEQVLASMHRNIGSHRQSPSTSRPSLQRSATVTTTIPRSKVETDVTSKSSPMRSTTAASITAEPYVKKAPSILSSWLRSPPTAQMSIKKVSCLTCGSDDIPIIKTAKLECTHRMCHDCLRRIFTMSVSDPAHMPPKCCTAEHIPLKHVDKLFDQKFKKTWNRKFQEYTTQNRIYCPTRHCGEWIKPNHISLEKGRKVGKCKQCGTRVCCTCNNKMHTSRDCPKDPATKIFVEVAKKEGWRRCFNCSAMVELKEGCNHMTCRCTAEFCMVCGNKWKTCDCPWFSYETVEADRLEHMNPAEGPRAHNDDDRRAPIRYQEEVDRRRQQERRDEAFARRMQMLGVDEDPAEEIVGDGNLGQPFGIGNAADHFPNRNLRHPALNIFTANLRHVTRTAAGLVDRAVAGRETALPPALLDLPTPARDVTSQTTQLLRHDGPSNATLNIEPLPDWQALRRSRAASGMAHRATNAGPPAEAIIPLPPPVSNPVRRTSSLRNQFRRASGLESLLAGAGRSQTPNGKAAERRIENWISDVPYGEAAEGVALT